MKALYKTLVRQVLEEIPSARGSDDILFAEILRRCDTTLSPYQKQCVIDAFSNGCGVNYDSIRRSRQRVQELHPELKPPERITALRVRREGQIKSELYEEEHNNG